MYTYINPYTNIKLQLYTCFYVHRYTIYSRWFIFENKEIVYVSFLLVCVCMYVCVYNRHSRCLCHIVFSYLIFIISNDHSGSWFRQKRKLIILFCSRGKIKWSVFFLHSLSTYIFYVFPVHSWEEMIYFIGEVDNASSWLLTQV